VHLFFEYISNAHTPPPLRSPKPLQSEKAQREASLFVGEKIGESGTNRELASVILGLFSNFALFFTRSSIFKRDARDPAQSTARLTQVER
jgi:hypothetical protein